MPFTTMMGRLVAVAVDSMGRVVDWRVYAPQESEQTEQELRARLDSQDPIRLRAVG